jgi:3-deoxy-D-manno-octulosonate 8-phosphate phosphatase KdsC-like HAD superfamily phosphatase
MTYFEELCSKIQIIVSEVDGIVTDGYTTITESGTPLFKFFCLKDFDAINQLKRDFKFIFLSSDNYISHNVMRSKNINFY